MHLISSSLEALIYVMCEYCIDPLGRTVLTKSYMKGNE